jgi:bacteriorhodopsin
MILPTALASIVIQFITAIIDIFGIALPVDNSFQILKDILKVELGVQTIELIFYIWLVFSIHSIKNITLYRYADWFITTPVMLITLMAYLSINPEKTVSLKDFLKTNKSNIWKVVGLNGLMLLFGFLSELFPVHQVALVGLGFIPFVMYFYLIYKEYLQKEKPDVHSFFTRKSIFWYFVVTWSLYGVFALFPYVLKNSALNILDLFSKNAFGMMLVVILWSHRIRK